MKGFREFLLKSNAIALAIAVIIGLALNNVVQSLVNDILMPPIGMLLGKIDFSQLKIVLNATGDPKTEVAIRYGIFLNAIIAFVIIAITVYVISKLLIKEPKAAPTKTCQYCKETVPADAIKCRACTSTLTA